MPPLTESLSWSPTLVRVFESSNVVLSLSAEVVLEEGGSLGHCLSRPGETRIQGTRILRPPVIEGRPRPPVSLTTVTDDPSPHCRMWSEIRHSCSHPASGTPSVLLVSTPVFISGRLRTLRPHVPGHRGVVSSVEARTRWDTSFPRPLVGETGRTEGRRTYQRALRLRTQNRGTTHDSLQTPEEGESRQDTHTSPSHGKGTDTVRGPLSSLI